MERKTRISRKRFGEITLKDVIREDLQDKFLKLLELQDHSKTLQEALSYNQSPENHRAAMYAQREEIRHGFDFWIELRELYGNWSDPLGIRDGFELVICRTQRNITDILNGGPPV